MKCHSFLKYCLIVSCPIFLAHFSSQQSVTSKERPAVNVYGTIKDQSEETYDVENITIAGMYKQIPVYKKPHKKKINPEANTTFLDLADLSEIRVPYQGESPDIYTYNHREYITIDVISNAQTPAGGTQQTKNSYIIDRTRYVTCDRNNEEKKINFEAIDTIVIKGYKENKPDKNCK